MSQQSEILDIIQGISQVLADSHDSYPNKEIGLNREKVNSLTGREKRINDGFTARIQGDKLIVTYQSDIRLQDVHDNKFKNEIEEMLGKIVKWIKEQYKRVTKKNLALSKTKDETKILVQRTSNVRTFVQAQAVYQIGGIDFSSTDKYEEKFVTKFKEWMKKISK